MNFHRQKVNSTTFKVSSLLLDRVMSARGASPRGDFVTVGKPNKFAAAQITALALIKQESGREEAPRDAVVSCSLRANATSITDPSTSWLKRVLVVLVKRYMVTLISAGNYGRDIETHLPLSRGRAAAHSLPSVPWMLKGRSRLGLRVARC